MHTKLYTQRNKHTTQSSNCLKSESCVFFDVWSWCDRKNPKTDCYRGECLIQESKLSPTTQIRWTIILWHSFNSATLCLLSSFDVPLLSLFIPRLSSDSLLISPSVHQCFPSPHSLLPCTLHIFYTTIWHLFCCYHYPASPSCSPAPSPRLSFLLATELVSCQAPGLISCLSWRRGQLVQRDQLLGRCQLWALGTVWHAEPGYTSGDRV